MYNEGNDIELEKQNEKKGTIWWIMHWAGRAKGSFVLSVIFAIMKVICKMIPYFVIGKVVTLIMNKEQNISEYMIPMGIIAGAFVLAEICHLISTSTSHKVTFEILGQIKKEALDKLAQVPLGYIKDTGSGTFKNIIVERVDSIETTLAHMIPEVSSGILAIVMLIAYFFVIDYRIALFALIPVVVGTICGMGMFKDSNEKAMYAFRKTKELNDISVEHINGIEVIKAFGRTERSYAKFKDAAKAGADCYIEWMRSCIWFQTLMSSICPYLLLSVLPAGAYYVLKGALTVGDYVTCIILSLGIIGPLMSIMGYFDDIRKMGAIVGDVTGIITQPELIRPETSKKLPEDSSIRLSKVCFGYHDQEILHGIDMVMNAGEINAIVGPSGSGKSTIAKLVASMWDVNSGAIEIGGVNLKDISLKDINDRIAYVAQDNYLFDRTVMENIRMGHPGATDEEVIEITKKSGCYDFIMQLENGFETVVGGAGGHLSGGERQRISIARAMLKDAPIVILDEATAYTDPENEAILQMSLSKLVNGKTLIVIAHRLSTIVDADNIFVVKDGLIEAHGKHEELLNSCDLYKRMWESHIAGRDNTEEGGER